MAAGLGPKPDTSTYGVVPPALRRPTPTLLGMAAMPPQAPPKVRELAVEKTLVSMPAQRAPKPANSDGDPTEVLDSEAMDEALRQHHQEQAARRGFEGIPEAAPEHQLGADKQTPRRQRMTPLESGK